MDLKFLDNVEGVLLGLTIIVIMWSFLILNNVSSSEDFFIIFSKIIFVYFPILFICFIINMSMVPQKSEFVSSYYFCSLCIIFCSTLISLIFKCNLILSSIIFGVWFGRNYIKKIWEYFKMIFGFF